LTTVSGDDECVDDDDAVLHKTLARQLRLLKLKTSVAPTIKDWELLLSDVSAVYSDYDSDRRSLERAVEISSREMQTLNEQLTEQASKDGMTGLLNRTSLMTELDLHLKRLQRGESTMLGLLFIDLDGFKLINDRLGHAVGDELLCTVAERLQNCIRSEDVVARLGGDEFVVLAPDLPNKHLGITQAERIVSTLSQTVRLPNISPLGIGASIGVATVSSDQETSAEELLKQADLAMYSAKMNGRNRVVIFTGGLESESYTATTTEDLREAITNNQLVLHYQPIVCLAHNRIVAMEALVRWQHPERGIIPPDEFIPLAENSGLIHDLTRLVLTNSLQALTTWEPELRVTVNLSPKDIGRNGTVDLLHELSHRTGADLSKVVLEITEGNLVEWDDTVIGQLRSMLDTGIQLAIDDFGSGYSSLSRLLDLPVQFLKLDRKFVEPLANHKASQAVVRTVLELAQTLDLTVIAEGIETAEQAETLRMLGCGLAQGYYFGRPVPVPDPKSVGCIECTKISYKEGTFPSAQTAVGF